ncbi:TetR/AcrR family transcriptional regulator [Planotetraspora kaengkrachanensis]|uniref:TetR family transcriptional regulator n=1 Tax=Planotetraspora kaengkrachanensis TaxID=575193 RepID=A0A8J3PXK6_9ACTN|nr:TetR/AcrR family transcriptional regulator [Planotetraspora kaengkrachanensis]GIG82835.1 TetR family transcriptional regulator [Planotetraspora kaengkrachanensis]
MARPMRADARRNQEQILLAARDLVAERGPDVPLDEVARRAGVGIGTLYRRFPDREALLHALALDALTRTVAAAHAAAEQETDPFDALARYLREALELRVSAVLPALMDVVDLGNDPELGPVREKSARLVRSILDRARTAGALPHDVTFEDVGMMLVRIARPLPGPLPAEAKHELARRHLELFIRGLGALAAGEPAVAAELRVPG